MDAERRRVALTFIDQIVSSTSNFLTGVAVARLSGAAEFGQYSLVLTIWLVIVGVHRRVITEPMVITGGGDGDFADRHIARGLTAELLFGGTVTFLVAVVGGLASMTRLQIGTTLLALAPWLIGLLVQDYWRAVAFQRRRPDLALRNDLAFTGAQIILILVVATTGLRSATWVIAAWGCGGMCGAILGFLWFPAVAAWRDGWRLLCEMWVLSRWMLADFVTAFGSQQSYIVVAALVLSLVEYGGFRAATSLLGPIMVILLAAGNVGLPEAARRANPSDQAELLGYARRLTIATTLSVIAYGVPLIVSSRVLLDALYGPEFSRFSSLAILAWAQYVVIASVFGPTIVLRAAGRLQTLLLARMPITLLSLASLVVSVHYFGWLGAGVAGVLTGAYETAAIQMIYRRERKRGLAGWAGRSLDRPAGGQPRSAHL